MLTRTMRVRDARPEDLETVQSIAAENGRVGYQWPWGGAWGAIAILDEKAVAFCAGRDVNQGILIEDLWAVQGQDGVRGLSAISDWIEEQAKDLARRMDQPVNLGGIVYPSNVTHQRALEHRGYRHYANVLAKVVNP
jgi:hypothetical protein